MSDSLPSILVRVQNLLTVCTVPGEEGENFLSAHLLKARHVLQQLLNMLESTATVAADSAGVEEDATRIATAADVLVKKVLLATQSACSISSQLKQSESVLENLRRLMALTSTESNETVN